MANTNKTSETGNFNESNVSGPFDSTQNPGSKTQGRGWMRAEEELGFAPIEGGPRAALRDGLAYVQDEAGELYEKAKDIAADASDKTTAKIREYPVESLVLGFGVGCLVGFLIPRR